MLAVQVIWNVNCGGPAFLRLRRIAVPSCAGSPKMKGWLTFETF